MKFQKHRNNLGTCDSCGKRTHVRPDRRAADGVHGICGRCIDAAGLENAHNDGHHDGHPHPDCPDCSPACQDGAHPIPPAGSACAECAPRTPPPAEPLAPAPAVVWSVAWSENDLGGWGWTVGEAPDQRAAFELAAQKLADGWDCVRIYRAPVKVPR